MDQRGSFGPWLKQRRKALDLTQAALAHQVGCAVITLRKLEAGEFRPSAQFAAQLAAHLELTAEEQAAFVALARASPPAERAPVPGVGVSLPARGLPELHDAPVPRQPVSRVERRRTNLVAPTTPLLGRTHAIATLAARLRQGEARLLTLTGPGGTGKTRLALGVAADVLDAYADGVWFVDLAPLRDAALVASTIAQTLNVPQVGEQPPIESLLSYLRQRRLLLVLDNFEHLPAAVPLVGALLARASGLQLLVTSRALLHLYGEHEVAVAPLAVPDRHVRSADMLRDYAAVALFVQRAQAARHDFTLTDDTAPAVAEICRRLDGLPLALELAAARSKLFAPEALLARLQQRLPLLSGGRRDAPARQQTMRAAIDWSFDLLQPDELRLLTQLGVFVDGCTPAAAAAVCGEDRETAEPAPASQIPLGPRPEPLDQLSSLVDQSLLQVEVGTDGEPRFRMLETIREYAQECLAAGGAAEATRRRHAAYFLMLAEESQPWRFDDGGTEQFRYLEAELANFRAALAWNRRADDSELTTARLLHALVSFWTRTHAIEARPWLEELLRELGPAGVAAAPHTLVWAQTLLHMAFLGTYEPALGTPAPSPAERQRRVREASIARFRTAGDRRALARALFMCGNIAQQAGEFAAGQAYLEESIALAREVGDAWALRHALSYVGSGALDVGDLGRAAEVFGEGLSLARQTDDDWSIARNLEGLADVALEQGRAAEAERLFADAQARYQALDDPWGPTSCRFGIAEAAAAQGHTARAIDGYESVLLELRDSDPRLWAVPLTLERLAEFAAASDAQPEGARRAARLFGAVAAWRAAFPAPIQPSYRARYERDLAIARARLGDSAFAAAWAEGQAMTLEQAIAYTLGDMD